MENICSIVVWYNPDEKSIENILSYQKFVRRIYVIDNSSEDNSNLLKNIDYITYISNKTNLGIAKALNIGCELAIKDNFEWTMTMDQDSSWNECQIKKYFDLFNEYQNEVNVSFAPIHISKIKNSSVIGDLKRFLFKNVNKEQSDILFKTKVMASGNIINLKVWERVGKFNEMLFIDEVDHEFCYRLVNKKYNIIEFPNIYVNHNLGIRQRTFLPKLCNHKGVRLYYIYRNMLYIKKYYFHFYKLNGYNKYFYKVIIELLFSVRWKDLSYVIRGIKDFRKNQFGMYKKC